MRVSLPDPLMNTSGRNPALKRQRGFLMVGTAIAVMAAAALLALAADRMVQENRLQRGKQVGDALAILGDGLEVYLNTYYSALSNTSVDLFPPSLKRVIPNPRSVTPEQLIAYFNLRGVSKTVPHIDGANYRFSFDFPLTAANGQSCEVGHNRFSDPRCRITGLVYIDRPLLRGGKLDGVATARAARTIGRFGGYSPTSNPGILEFVGGPAGSVPRLNNVTNPVSPVAGILVRAVNPLLYQTEYLRVDGANTMEAPLQMQDIRGKRHDIRGAENIHAKGFVWATSQGLETGSHGAWLTGDGDVIASTGLITAREKNIEAWRGNIVAKAGNIVAESGEIVAEDGRIVAKNEAIESERRHVQGNTFVFNRASATSSTLAKNQQSGLFARKDAYCGDTFAIAAGPSTINTQDSEQLYICTHDVYESSKAVIWFSGGSIGFDPWYHVQDPRNPGYTRSNRRVWRPIDQKMAVVQRYQLRDEAWTKAKLGHWQICVDSTAPFDTYKSTGGGYPSPIVGRFSHDVVNNSWSVDYWRNTNDQRDNGLWGWVTCSGKI